MKMKKLLTAAAMCMMTAVLMAPAVSVPVSADPDTEAATTLTDDSTATLTLTGAKKGDIFVAYKLIDIKYNSTTNTVSYSWDNQIKECMSFVYQESNIDTPAVAEFTVEYYINLGAEKRKKLLASLYNHIHNGRGDDHVIQAIPISKGSAATEVTVGEDKSAVWQDVEMGGYIIEPVTTTDVYEFIFKGVEPVPDANGLYTLNNVNYAVESKHNPVHISKFTALTSDRETGTAEIGEDITYYIIADVPKYGANSLKKEFSIKDVLPDGIDIDPATITVMSNTIAATEPTAAGWVKMEPDTDYSLTYEPSSGHVAEFTVNVSNDGENKQFDNWYSYSIAGDGTITPSVSKLRIMVTYHAKLNDKAVLAEKGVSGEVITAKSNPNTATLTFMPFPYVIDENNVPKTDHVDDSFRVYTYGAEIWKYATVSGVETGLTGAAFKIFYADNQDKATDALTGVYYSTDKTDWTLVTDTTEMITNNGHLYIKGLKSNSKYVVEEVRAPAQYNLPAEADRKFIIDTTLASNSAVLQQTQNEEDTKMREAAEYGYVRQKIENHKGFTLPETGGTGVMILKVIGVIVMAAAVIVVAVILLRPKTKKAE